MADDSSDARTPAGRPVVLVIRDGWGESQSPPNMVEAEGNATILAETPVNDRLLETCPSSLLEAGGEAVGLPKGQMGNSEVGHLNLGAGRIVYQSLTRITRAIREGRFFEIPTLVEIVERVKSDGGRLHVLGLCSDGGVHSHLEHLYAVLELARRHELHDVFMHCITDGRDTSPTGGAEYVRQIGERASEIGTGAIASIIGRYYAMDRDKRWERTAEAYNLFVRGKGRERDDPVAALREWYEEDKTDEFIPATVIRNSHVDPADQVVRDGDGVVFFNFRADRARQITRALCDDHLDAFDRDPRPRVHFLCMTEYEDGFGLPVAFPPETMQNIVADVVAAHGLKQFRIAETEKYAHVTYFFNGGIEEPVEGEERCLIPSPKVSTYDQTPQMSAVEVTDELIARIESGKYDMVLVNYANPDMVGHTGSIPAAVKAVESADACVGRLLETLESVGGVALVTADHGNADRMLDEGGKPFTAHTTNPVRIYYFGPDRERWTLKPGILADVAPTMLQLLDLPVPAEMTGSSLLVERRHGTG